MGRDGIGWTGMGWAGLGWDGMVSLCIGFGLLMDPCGSVRFVFFHADHFFLAFSIALIVRKGSCVTVMENIFFIFF